MRIERRLTRRGAGLSALAVLVGTTAVPCAAGAEAAVPAPGACRVLASAVEESPGKDCCFTNPAYGGVCVVQPAEDETCGSILAYLNNEQSTGRSYCNRTNIRGGWKQARCEEQATTAAESTPR